MRSFLVLIFLATLIAVLTLCERTGDIESVHDSTQEGYVGESACISCHNTEYDLWKGSHHDWAMKLATDETVLGDFNDHQISLDGVDYRFFKDGDAFMVQVTEINGKTESYTIDHTFGVTAIATVHYNLWKG